MKKTIILLMSFIFILTIVGCSDKEVTTNEISTEKKQERQKEPKEEFYFDGEIAEISDARLKITNTKVIEVGEEGNEYGDKPVFAIWYEVTNKSDKEMVPSDIWFAIFEVIQDNSDDVISKLSVGLSPDKAHLDTQFNIIKKDGTSEDSIAYELDDLATPVTLIATKGYGGDKLGEKEYKID